MLRNAQNILGTIKYNEVLSKPKLYAKIAKIRFCIFQALKSLNSAITLNLYL